MPVKLIRQSLVKLRYVIQCLSALAIFLLTQTAYAELTLNLSPGVTPISHDIYELHMTILWICVGIGIVVFSIFFFSLYRYRKSKEVTPSKYHGNLVIEAIWAIVPFIILIGIAFPATHVLFAMNDDSDPEMTIKVTGHQWQWDYSYLDEGIQFYSLLSTPQSQLSGEVPPNKFYLYQVDNPLVVPINKKIRLLFTSSDVIHSWWVHELGVKRDAMPGIITEYWMKIKEPGTYRGSCAELCGLRHAYMPIVVEAKTQEEYDEWLNARKAEQLAQQEAVSQTYTYDELMKNGEQKYNMICSACHGVGGEGQIPVFPALRGDSVVTGEPISRHIDIVLNGVPGTVMRGFGDQLDDFDMASIITYERNAWGNNTGDVVQPSMIQERR